MKKFFIILLTGLFLISAVCLDVNAAKKSSGAKISKEVVLNKDLPCYIEAVFENNGEETVISREISSLTSFLVLS